MGPNTDATGARISFLRSILRRLLEPLSLILLLAGVVSALTGDSIGGTINVALMIEGN